MIKEEKKEDESNIASPKETKRIITESEDELERSRAQEDQKLEMEFLFTNNRDP